MININGLYKAFGKNQVLRDVNLNFEGSGITAILGPNGSGKTTLLKCFLGLTHFDDGDILFDGQTVKNQHAYRSKVSHLPQIATFPDNLTPLDLIHMIKDLREEDSNEDYFVDMFDLKPELNKKMAFLSGGNKQKVNLLLSLMFDNPLLILDEPTSGLDPVAIINLKRYLKAERSKGKLILITTHIMSFVEELADKIVFLLDGKIYFDGNTQALMLKHEADSLELAIANILQGGSMNLKTIRSNAI